MPISDGDVWVCDPDSLYYNTMQRNSGTRDWDAAQAENLYRKFHDDYSAACIMFKKMTPIRTMSFVRADRTAIGHQVEITYIANVTI